MVVVFVLGLIVSSLLERRAEVVSIYNNLQQPQAHVQGLYRVSERALRRGLPPRVPDVG